MTKFKDLAGSTCNWKNSSNLCSAISAISTHVYDINLCIKGSLNVVDNLCFVCCTCIIQKSQSHFCRDKKVDLKTQGNYKHLASIEGVVFDEEHYHLMQQLTPNGMRLGKRLWHLEVHLIIQLDVTC